jgi:predicted O-methyltransferase YrrM
MGMLDHSVDVATDTEDPESIYARAQNCLGKNDFENAAIFLRQAVEMRPDDVTFNLAFSLTLFLLGDISDSLENFSKAISLDEGKRNTPEYANVADFKSKLFGVPQYTLAGFFQGGDAPERQVFMSAALASLKKNDGTTRILEIGSYGGASMLTWSYAAEKLLDGSCEIVCVDPWGDAGTNLYDATMAKNLKSTRAYEVFRHNASIVGDSVQIIPMRGCSSEILPKLDDDKFDLIFIDGSHHYQDVFDDIRESDRLLKVDGIICGDDLELQLFECDAENTTNHKHFDYIQDPNNGIYYHPGVTLAVEEYFGEVSNFSGFWAMESTPEGYRKISFSKATGLRPSHWPGEFQSQITDYFEKSTELGKLL